MKSLLKQRFARTGKKGAVIVLPSLKKKEDPTSAILKVVGWSSVAIGVATLGLFIGRELRLRYKFNRRTPYDAYSHAGDQIQSAEYGIGV